MVRPVLLIFAVALASSAGCGGTLAPPDDGGGGGGSGGRVFPRPTGSGGGMPIDAGAGSGGAPGEAEGGARDCLRYLPAPPVVGAPCRYEIPAPPCSAVDRGHIGVLIDDVQIPRDTIGGNGWDYTDATFTTIDIHGASCDALMNGSAAVVTVFFYIILI
jgi:hypothetical protein